MIPISSPCSGRFEDLQRPLIQQRLSELRSADRNLGSSARNEEALRQAAVALVMCPNEAGESCFVLTRRAAGLRNHGGQWALPGGRMEPGELPSETAIRELGEEVGLTLEPDTLLGYLDDFTTRSGFRITPVVLWCAEPPVMVADANEVAAIHLISLSQFDRADVPFLRAIPESERLVLSLPMHDHEFFAPTAAIVYQFFELAYNNRIVRVDHFEQPVFAWK